MERLQNWDMAPCAARDRLLIPRTIRRRYPFSPTSTLLTMFARQQILSSIYQTPEQQVINHYTRLYEIFNPQ